MNDLLRCISASSRHWANTLKPWWEPASRYWGSCKMLIKAVPYHIMDDIWGDVVAVYKLSADEVALLEEYVERDLQRCCTVYE